MICVAKGDSIDMEKVLSKFQITLTSVNEFARSMAQG